MITTMAYWNMLELGFAVVTACQPTFRYLFKDQIQKLQSSLLWRSTRSRRSSSDHSTVAQLKNHKYSERVFHQMSDKGIHVIDKTYDFAGAKDISGGINVRHTIVQVEEIV